MANLAVPLFEQTLSAAWPPDDWRNVTVILAVSGGADSVALLRAMAALKEFAGGAGRLIIAHFNHKLRPEADDDARFVAALSQRLNLPLEVGSYNVAQLAADRGDGVEAAAREARYDFLRQTAEKHGARYVATAHTADDQIETVLFNLLRGTGLAGLAGIERARLLGPAVSLIRPILGIHRREVLLYLKQIGQDYCTDASNLSMDYSRNRIRNELLPLLREKYNPEVDSAIGRVSQLSGDAQAIIEQLAEDLLAQCLRGDCTAANTVRFSIAPLHGLNRHLVREMFIALWRRAKWPMQRMGFADRDALAELAATSSESNPSTKRTFPGNVSAECIDDVLVLMRPSG